MTLVTNGTQQATLAGLQFQSHACHANARPENMGAAPEKGAKPPYDIIGPSCQVPGILPSRPHHRGSQDDRTCSMQETIVNRQHAAIARARLGGLLVLYIAPLRGGVYLAVSTSMPWRIRA